MPYSSPSAPRVDAGRLASMQQAIQRNPQVAALLRQGNTAGAEYYIRTHRGEFGFDLPSGYRLQPNGSFQYTATTNQDHWYSDPRILGPAAVAAGGGLAALAGPAATGGAGAASSAMPATMTASAPAIASQGISASVPLGAVTSGAGAVGGTANLGRKLLDNLTSVDGLTSLAPMIAALASGGMGGGGNGGGPDNAFLERAYGDAQRQNAMQEARYRRVDPLHQAVSQLAFSRLPISSRQGITMNQVPLPPQEQ